jgi:flagellar basal-body rod modification protein FlgD
MSVSAVQQATGAQAVDTSSSQMGQLGKLDFLKLLVMQMRYQDPLEPMKDTEYIAQLAQFNSLEQMQNLNSSVSEMERWMQTGQASSLLNKNVEVADTATGSLVTGMVSEVRFRAGEPRLVVGEQEVALADVVKIY